MKILLVYPRTRYPTGDIPIGLSILGAVLKNAGHGVEVFDASFLKSPAERFRSLLRARKFDFIGMSLMTTMAAAAAEFSRIAKKEQPDSKIIAGGPHPTVMTEHTLKEIGADVCVVGEGEETLPELVSGSQPENTPGAAALFGDEIRFGPPRAPIQYLDPLPFPDFPLFDTKKYIDSWFSLDGVSPRSRGVNIIATRGCPFSCAFCQPTLRRIFGNTVRRHSPEYIAELVGSLVSKFRINSFMFEDDTFTLDRDWCAAVCGALASEHPGIYWGCNAHVRTLDREMLETLKAGGLRKIFIGIESGAQRVLDDIYKKGFRLEEAAEKIKTAKELGLKIHAYFMLGAPTETENEIVSTIKFAVKSGLDEASFNIASPLPGTDLYEKYSSHISVRTGEIDYYNRPAFDEIIALPPGKLVSLKKSAIFRFYLHGRRPLAVLKSMMSPTGLWRFFLKLRRF